LEPSSHCRFDSPNDAFPEDGMCGDKGKAAGLRMADGFAVFGRGRRTSGQGAETRLLTRDRHGPVDLIPDFIPVIGYWTI
jgi:hypothetical protein